ncbi:hypothetical protein VNO77_42023 [Canavalia gladiata]|uniref:F-box domain-containing protein n=1 Tax=Canavalia gladiata TaxID=3824 RepID=A0AAN9PT03_CANGL
MACRIGEDLEAEILVRLPAKSLMRFKCVHRSWNALIRRPNFVRRHTRMRSTGERFMILVENRDRSPVHWCPCITLLSYDDNDPPQQFEYPFPNEYPSFLTRIMWHCYCDGILCLYVANDNSRRDQYIFWNPCTREVKVAYEPEPPFISSNFALQGFGVDPNTNDFKVVYIPIFQNSNWAVPVLSVKVYNLSTDSWTVLDFHAIPPGTYITHFGRSQKCNTLVDGVYHWLISNDGDILCFDFRNDQFSKLKAPVLFRPSLDYIAEVNGSIAYIAEYYDYNNRFRLDIWVMDQHIWSKKYSIGPLHRPVYNYGIWKDGIPVLGGRHRQPLNPNAHPIRQFQFNTNLYARIRSVDGYAHLPIHSYKETIAPLSF